MLLDYLTLNEHAGYLKDAARLTAYEQALRAVVRPGDAVLDLGAGTGVLGLLALRAGAGRVYVVDAGPMLEVARAVHAANGTTAKAVFVQGGSQRVVLPERVDVVVSDQLGPFVTGAGLLAAYADAVGRHLKPAGRLVPERLETWVAPAQVDLLREELDLWSGRPAGLEMSPLRGVLRGAYHVAMPPAKVLRLGPGQALEPLELHQPRQRTLERQARLEVAQAGRLDALASWFVAHLAPGVRMTNAPDAPDRISRHVALLPLDPAPDVPAGGTLDFDLRLDPRTRVGLWTVGGASPSGARWERRHSTLEALLLTPDTLRRAAGTHRPALSGLGRARARVFALADGRTDLAQMADAVGREHPAIFVDAESALEFVRETLDSSEELDSVGG